jgi:hypothetical protein
MPPEPVVEEVVEEEEEGRIKGCRKLGGIVATTQRKT